MTQADTAPTDAGQFTASGVTFHHGHRVLEDFAQDLALGLLRPLSAPVDVFVGIHKIPKPIESGRLRVGIQTEQIFDRNRNLMWDFPNRAILHKLVAQYDYVLDLSADNQPAYGQVSDSERGRLRFGPHIFPDTELTASYVEAAPLFVGWRNNRRNRILEDLQLRRPIGTLDRKVFGERLRHLLAKHGAVLNLHYRDGEYCEFPRFLKACLAGKPFLSEPMSDPLVEGKDYLPLDADPSPDTTERLFEAIRELAAGHRFRDCLESIIRSGARTA